MNKFMAVIPVLIILSLLGIVTALIIYDINYEKNLEWSTEWQQVSLLERRFIPTHMEDVLRYRRVWDMWDMEYTYKWVSVAEMVPDEWVVEFCNGDKSFNYNSKYLYDLTEGYPKIIQEVKKGYDVKKEKVTRVKYTDNFRKGE